MSAGTRINAGRLREEIAARGMTETAFAELAGLTLATISHACCGRPVTSGTLRKLGIALTRQPRLAGLDGLIGNDDRAAPA